MLKRLSNVLVVLAVLVALPAQADDELFFVKVEKIISIARAAIYAVYPDVSPADVVFQDHGIVVSCNVSESP